MDGLVCKASSIPDVGTLVVSHPPVKFNSGLVELLARPFGHFVSFKILHCQVTSLETQGYVTPLDHLGLSDLYGDSDDPPDSRVNKQRIVKRAVLVVTNERRIVVALFFHAAFTYRRNLNAFFRAL